MLKINKEMLWIAGGQVVGLLNNFLLLKLLTVNLSMTAYGYYTLWMSTLLFIRQIIFDPFSIISAKESIGDKFFAGIDGVGTMKIVRYATDRFFVCLLLACSLLISIDFIFYKNHPMSGYLIIGAIYLGSNGAQGIYLNILNVTKKRKWAAAGIMADSFVKLGLVAAVFLLYEKNTTSAIQAVAISSLFVFILVRSICDKLNSPGVITKNERLSATKKLVMLSLPLLAPTLLIALKGVGDKIFMAAFIGVEELAAYNVLLQLGFIPIMLIIGVIQTYVSPDIYKLTSGGKGNYKNTISYIRSIIYKILIISTFAIISSLVFSDLVFEILVGVEYFKYSKFLPYFVLAGALAGISGLLNIVVIGAFKSKLVGVLMLASVSAGLIIFMILIVIHGFKGGIAGLIFSNFVMMLVFGSSLWLIQLKKND